jgi:hypothetical protein
MPSLHGLALLVIGAVGMAWAPFGHPRVMDSVDQDDAIITERKVETAALPVGVFFKKGSADMSAVHAGAGERAAGVTRESFPRPESTVTGDWDDYGVGAHAVCIERTTQGVWVKTLDSSAPAEKAPITSDANGLATATVASGNYVNGFVAPDPDGSFYQTDRSGTKWVHILPNWATKEVAP